VATAGGGHQGSDPPHRHSRRHRGRRHLGGGGGTAHAAAAAWLGSIRSFYEAGRLGQPLYGPLVASFVPRSPALEQTEAWLSALSAAGVVAPATYRVGNVRVTSLHGRRAVVDGCMYDTGSVYRSTGKAAPAAFGGGAGLTASVAVLRDVGDHWLVWSDQTSAVASSKEEGPCHGF
jgi:hypothetical protein